MERRRLSCVPGRALRSAPGVTLIEVLTVLALLSWLLAATIPAMSSALQRARLRAAARDLATTFRQCRLAAVLENRQVGVVFDPACGWCWTVHVDGNGNGIRRADIRSGVDRRTSGPSAVSDLHAGVAVRFVARARISRIPPEPGFLPDLTDPVQFGPSDIVSFSPGGSSSSGTIYLTTGRERMAGVRVQGSSARVRIYEYDPTGDSWQEW